MAQRENAGIVMMCVIFTLFMLGGVVYFLYQQGAVTTLNTGSGPAIVPPPPAAVQPYQMTMPPDSLATVRSMSRMINENPDLLDERLVRAAAYEELGDYEEAIADCNWVLEA